MKDDMDCPYIAKPLFYANVTGGGLKPEPYNDNI